MKKLASAATSCNASVTLPDRYPTVPGFKVDGASREAAEAIKPTARNLRDRVLTLVQSLDHDEAITADQIASRLQRSPLSVRPRVSELAATGKLVRTSDRGRNESGMSATKWRAA
jgi:hypothetical protein